MEISKEVKQLADKYTGQHCFLVVGGKRHSAIISGRQLPFARVTAVLTSSQSVEFCWQTVDRIMQSTKEFKS